MSQLEEKVNYLKETARFLSCLNGGSQEEIYEEMHINCLLKRLSDTTKTMFETLEEIREISRKIKESQDRKNALHGRLMIGGAQ